MEVYRKPDGSYTKSPVAMVRAWRAIAKELGVITGTRLTGFDPTVSLRNEETGELVQLPVWFVSRIHEYFAANGLKPKPHQKAKRKAVVDHYKAHMVGWEESFKGYKS